MPTPRVIDLYHGNKVQSLLSAKQAGVLGVIHKCTEGTSFVDDKCAARRYLTQEAGMLWGLYHFLRPGSMEKQADFFLAKASPVMNESTLLAADHEDAGVSLFDLYTFLGIVQAHSGRSPVIYSGHLLKDQLSVSSALDLTGYRLWLAQYSTTPTLPPGFESYWLWQYTDKGTVPGISPPTDISTSELTDEELASQWTQWTQWGDPLDKPKPEPPKPSIYTTRITITSDSPIHIEVEEIPG